MSQHCKRKSDSFTKNISGLDVNYTFELIPDCQAATEAGYSAQDRANAQCWYGPELDENYIYYTAWSGSILSPTHKSSILCCRRRSDGELVYAKNCGNYNLDTAPNFVGDSSTICRCKPAIYKNRLYLVNAVMSNIGNQLYAIDKLTGNLIWACGYYPPEGAPSYVTTKGDYSKFTGSNMRVSDLIPVVFDNKGKICIIVGTSSFQNAINSGMLTKGFPFYTDQGFLFCIEDLGNTSQLVWKVGTSAPLLKVGDKILKGGAPEYDPFRPTEDKVVLTSLSSDDNYFEQPYFLPNAPSPGIPLTCPFATRVVFTKTTVINKDLVQPIWGKIANIYLNNDRIKSYNLDDLILLWKNIQENMLPNETKEYNIWSFVDKKIVDLAISQKGNINILYFKYLLSGQTIKNHIDAQGLNYWGNTTWGGNAYVDIKNNLIYYGSGQGHDIPLDENIFYANPGYNFKDLKKPLLNLIDRYIINSDNIPVSQINIAKTAFTDGIKMLALDVHQKSPRGRMSYSDGIFGVYINSFVNDNGITIPGGSLAFGVRSVPNDTFTFLNTLLGNIYDFNLLDGDVSSGIKLFKHKNEKYLATSAKHGLSPIINISKLNNNVIFNHQNLNEKGIKFEKLVFAGPNGALGGSNFLDSASDNLLISSQGNMSWFLGSTSTNNILERQISQKGELFDINNSFLQAISIPDGKIVWETPYYNRAHAEVIFYDNLIFSEDGDGSLYIFDVKNGDIIWKFNGQSIGLNGGIVAPAVNNNEVFWLNNYSAYGIIGKPGPNGACFKINPKILITDDCSIYQMFDNKYFISWDASPKFTPNPAINPKSNQIVTHQWHLSKSGNLRVHVTHQQIEPPLTEKYSFKVKCIDSKNKLVFFKNPFRINNKNIIYEPLKLINTNTYSSSYYEIIDNVKGPLNILWMTL